MTRLPVHKDMRDLRVYLQKAGEVGFRAYVTLIMSTLRERARETSNPLDDIVVLVLTVAVDRLFPPPNPGDQSANQG